MGRLWQLRQTLPEHLKIFKGRKDVQLVVVNYNSPDNLDRWIYENTSTRRAIDAGLLIYAKEHTAKHYSSPKAKNLAHRLATGDILFNLDADNWAGDVDGPLRAAFAESESVLFHSFNWKNGSTFGRIGLTRNWFFRLGGYDESFQPMLYQDVDIIARAKAAKLKQRSFVPDRHPIHNSDRQKIMLTGVNKTMAEMRNINCARSKSNIARGRLVANSDGWGSGLISINFRQMYRLQPVIPNRLNLQVSAIPHAEETIDRSPPVPRLSNRPSGWNIKYYPITNRSMVVVRDRLVYARYGG
jgi:hypothetical protein